MSKSKLLLEGGSLFSVVVEFSNFHHKKKRKGKNIRSGRLSLCVDRQNVLRDNWSISSGLCGCCCSDYHTANACYKYRKKIKTLFLLLLLLLLLQQKKEFTFDVIHYLSGSRKKKSFVLGDFSYTCRQSNSGEVIKFHFFFFLVFCLPRLLLHSFSYFCFVSLLFFLPWKFLCYVSHGWMGGGETIYVYTVPRGYLIF